MDFADANNVAALLQCMLQALRDPELPVQVEAANGLRHLIELDGTEVGRRKRTKARRNGRKEEEGEKGRRGRIEG